MIFDKLQVFKPDPPAPQDPKTPQDPPSAPRPAQDPQDSTKPPQTHPKIRPDLSLTQIETASVY